MQEIEVKILEIDVDAVRKTLLDLGAKKILDDELSYEILDDREQNLFKEKKLLRVRKSKSEAHLCFKSKAKKGKLRQAEETEVKIDNYDDTIKILNELGFITKHKGKKHRESYKLDKARYEIDTMPGIPTFLEIEADNEDDLIKGIEKIGFKLEDATTMNGHDVIEHYRNQK
jgi:adenylate cyclase, class 2